MLRYSLRSIEFESNEGSFGLEDQATQHLAASPEGFEMTWTPTYASS